jgi:hypothetical protein
MFIKHVLKRGPGVKDERGQTLIIVLILVAVGSLILAPLLSLMATGYTTTKNVYNQKNFELYAADAGVQSAIWKINYDPSSLPQTAGESISLPSLDENGKPVTITITCTSADNNTENPNSDNLTYRIESVAESTTTYAEVKYTTAADAYVPEEEEESGPLFNNALAALNGNVTVNAGGATITGDTYIGDNQLVINSWFNPIDGDVYAAAGVAGTRADDASLTSGHEITVNEGSPCLIPSPAPTYGTQDFDDALITMTDLKNQVYTLAYNINTPTPSGTPVSSLTVKNKGSSSSYYVYPDPINVTGNMSMTNSNYVIFNGTVCVGGNLTISGDAHVIFNAGVKIDGQLLMTSGGGTVTFNDTLTVGSINFTNGMTLLLNNDLKVTGNVNLASGGTLDLKGTVYVGGNLSTSGARQLVSYKAMYVNGNLSLTNGGYIVKSTDTPDEINKVIVVNGNITQSGGTTLGNTDQFPLIIDLTSGATISMSSGAKVNAALYAPSASVTLAGNAQFYGGMIAGSITLGTGSGSPGITWVDGLFSDITGGSGSGEEGGGGGEGGTAYPAVTAGSEIITWDIR